MVSGALGSTPDALENVVLAGDELIDIATILVRNVEANAVTDLLSSIEVVILVVAVQCMASGLHGANGVTA